MPFYINDITGEVCCQEDVELKDGRRDWKGKKMLALRVAELMQPYDRERAEKIRGCGTYLLFRVTPDGQSRLGKANFCRERMCPMCQWRRSIKLGCQADKIYRALSDGGYKHIFITLTVRNCLWSELNSEVDKLLDDFARLKRGKLWKGAIVGYYRALEITYNSDKGTYHPHIHILATVEGDYFRANNPDYITKDALIAAWKQVCKLDYDPSVDVEGIHQKPGQSITSACAEVCKYPLKVAELPHTQAMQTVDEALRGRRLIQWGGVAAEMRRVLELDDVESGNLVNIDDSVEESVIAETVYVWRYGFYLPVDFKRVRERSDGSERI